MLLFSRQAYNQRDRRNRLWECPAVAWPALALLCIGAFSACGYHLAGRGELPGGIQTIAVRLLDNHSSETGVETTFTNALINEINLRRQGSVVDPKKADAILAGSIESLTWDTVARKGTNVASERRVYASLSLALTDGRGHVLWKRSGLRAEQAYAVVAGNKTATENNRRQAIGILSEQMAEYVYRRLTDHF